MSIPFNRRTVLKTLPLGLAAARLSWPAVAADSTLVKARSTSVEWRTYRLKMRAAPTAKVTGLLLPMPLQQDHSYQRVLEQSLSGNFSGATLVRDPDYRADALLVKFAAETKKPEVELILTMQTRDRYGVEPESPAEDLNLYLRPTPHVPVDGLVREMALKIVRGAKTAESKAMAIHNWVVDNTVRDPKIAGCGIGDVNAILKSGTYGGKCADLNGLFVAFCRAAGIPAREVYGLRVGESSQFKSIGKSDSLSKAQHCRAEFFADGRGWIPADPADVRKVMLEENLALGDARVQAIRKKFFGFWEMNWIAYNSARDLKFAGLDSQLNYLMYPQSIGASLNSVDPDQFGYSIESIRS